MKVYKAVGDEFGSYKKVIIDLDNKGLCLVSGPTGAGKSTMFDLVPWTLFGVTAKNGAADDVINWQAESETTGRVTLLAKGKRITITRVRGKRKDLCFCYDGGELIRGKDIPDTQKLINNLLGMTPEVYLASAYYHEFSQPAAFFTATAKNRRQLTEQLADLSFATNLTSNAAEYKKQLKNEILSKKENLLKLRAYLESCKNQKILNKNRYKEWEIVNKDEGNEELTKYEAGKAKWQKDVEKEIQRTKTSIEEVLKCTNEAHTLSTQITGLTSRIDKLSAEICGECGSPKNSKQVLVLTKDKHQTEMRLNKIRQAITTAAQLERDIERLKKATYPAPPVFIKKANPYQAALLELTDAISQHTLAVEASQQEMAGLIEELENIELLSVVIDDLRAIRIKNTIVELEKQTNKFLSDYFDAEIKVAFTIEDADKLEVIIHKNLGYFVASYQQLSKGQRQLLKLTFSLAVMRTVSNYHGIQPSTIFLDEAMDGLDEQMKAKGLNLLNALTKEYSSVFFIDHSESIKAACNNRYEVSLIDGKSQIEKA